LEVKGSLSSKESGRTRATLEVEHLILGNMKAETEQLVQKAFQIIEVASIRQKMAEAVLIITC
jgi:hypothetical protein